ncbi:MAG: hypothetical protein P4M08_12720 [Oligoflexia bacterium]|nr:hypothetical protein [Oligoflexia bacterium]
MKLLKINRTYLNKIVDLALSFGAIACFTTYALQVHSIEKGIASGQSLAQLIDGTILKKSAGSPVFSEFSPEALLYNRDVVWVESSPSVKIRFDEGSTLTVQRGSLLIISRSLLSTNAGSRIQLLAGEIKLEKSWHMPWVKTDYEIYSGDRKVAIDESQRDITVRTEDKPAETEKPLPPQQTEPSLATAKKPQPVSSAAPSAPPESSRAQRLDQVPMSVHPKPNSILLKIGGQKAIVSFIWPNPVNGSLEVRALENASAEKSLPLHQVTRTSIPLGVEMRYEWVVKDATDGHVLYGPYTFKVLSTERHKLGQLIQTENKAFIEMLP